MGDEGFVGDYDDRRGMTGTWFETLSIPHSTFQLSRSFAMVRISIL